MTPAFVSPTPVYSSSARSATSRCVLRRPSTSPVSHSRRRFASINNDKNGVVMTAMNANEVETAPAWPCIDQVSANGNNVMSQSIMNTEDILKILPHRYPFLLVDRVIALEPGKRIMGIKSVTINEPFFPGHFPNRPIMPGVLQVEALAQLGGLVMLQPPYVECDPKDIDFFFGGVDKVKWRRPVTPGDTLIMEMTLDSFKKRFGIAKMSGKAYVNGEIVVEGCFTLVMIMDKSEK